MKSSRTWVVCYSITYNKYVPEWVAKRDIPTGGITGTYQSVLSECENLNQQL